MTDSPWCSLGPEAFEARADAWRALGASSTGREPTSTGVVLRFPLEPGLAETVLDLLEAERRCCPSVSFEATVTLAVDAPAGTRAWVRDTFLGHEGPSSDRSDQSTPE